MTAVEYLFEELLKLESQYYLGTIGRIDFRKKRLELLEQAKEMEEQQIIEAWDDGCYQSSDFPKTSDAETYYNETFKNTNK